MAVEVAVDEYNGEDIQKCLSCKKVECDNCMCDYKKGKRDVVYYYDGVGYTAKQIAKKVGMSKSTIGRYIKRYGPENALKILFKKGDE